MHHTWLIRTTTMIPSYDSVFQIRPDQVCHWKSSDSNKDLWFTISYRICIRAAWKFCCAITNLAFHQAAEFQNGRADLNKKLNHLKRKKKNSEHAARPAINKIKLPIQRGIDKIWETRWNDIFSGECCCAERLDFLFKKFCSRMKAGNDWVIQFS